MTRGPFTPRATELRRPRDPGSGEVGGQDHWHVVRFLLVVLDRPACHLYHIPFEDLHGEHHAPLGDVLQCGAIYVVNVRILQEIVAQHYFLQELGG